MTHLNPNHLTSIVGPAVDTPTYRSLRVRFDPFLDEIARGALDRELAGTLPGPAVALLKQEGFGAVRVPRTHGGDGASLPDLTQLWIDLAAVDNNLAQAFRGHFAFVEDRLWQHRRGDNQTAWFRRFVDGQIAGNAWSEVGPTSIDTQQTVLRRAGDDWQISGTKFYTTGSIFAEWADVYARRIEADGTEDFAIAVVDLRHPGASVSDDWDGFGQRGTGSGTATFDAVPVPGDNVLAFAHRFPYQTALYQLNLLATLTGIGKAALADTIEQVRARTRNYSHANTARVRDDPQVLARIGEIAAKVYVAQATTIKVAESLQAVYHAALGTDEEIARLNEECELESSAAQVVITDLILSATTELFDTLGASACSTGLGLDRHWRNARTVSSHNPRILKQRVVGQALVNQTAPPYAWAIGQTDAPVSETVGR